jgi:hypothetical protein
MEVVSTGRRASRRVRPLYPMKFDNLRPSSSPVSNAAPDLKDPRPAEVKADCTFVANLGRPSLPPALTTTVRPRHRIRGFVSGQDAVRLTGAPIWLPSKDSTPNKDLYCVPDILILDIYIFIYCGANTTLETNSRCIVRHCNPNLGQGLGCYDELYNESWAWVCIVIDIFNCQCNHP